MGLVDSQQALGDKEAMPTRSSFTHTGDIANPGTAQPGRCAYYLSRSSFWLRSIDLQKIQP
jgi:hypothetical protein